VGGDVRGEVWFGSLFQRLVVLWWFLQTYMRSGLFYSTISLEEHKTIYMYSGLRIAGMDLSNQSDCTYMMFLVSSYRIFQILWDGFGDWYFSDAIIFPAQQFWKMTSQNGLIPEDDLPRMNKSWKMTYREWPNPGLQQAGIGQAQEHQLRWSDVTCK